MSKEVKVLHLDDDENQLKRVGRNLEDELHDRGIPVSIDTATTLEEFRKLILGKAFDVLILDGNFPEKLGGLLDFNAPKAVQAILDNGNQGKVYIYSGEDLVNLEGVTAFIQKGIGSGEILIERIISDLQQ